LTCPTARTGQPLPCQCANDSLRHRHSPADSGIGKYPDAPEQGLVSAGTVFASCFYPCLSRLSAAKQIVLLQRSSHLLAQQNKKKSLAKPLSQTLLSKPTYPTYE